MNRKVLSLILSGTILVSNIVAYNLDGVAAQNKLEKNYIISNENLIIKKENLTFGDSIEINNTLDTFKSSPDITILARFNQSGSQIGSIIGVSDSNQNNSHFHVYSQNGVIGYELRGVSGGDIRGSVNNGNINEDNTIAFRISKQESSFEIYLNGELVEKREFSSQSFRTINDIQGLNSVYIGKTDRLNGNEYNFKGSMKEISVYNAALSKEVLKNYTSQTPSEAGNQIFDYNAIGSRAVRIPSLYTLQDGTVMAAIDARFGGSADSPNNIDTVVRYLKKGSDQWSEPIFPFYFQDYSNDSGYVKNSASFIDPSIVQDSEGTIHLTVDVFPAGYGYPNAKAGSGYKTIDGQKYLALTTKDKDPTKFSNFSYYIKDNKIYDKDGNETGYSVDDWFNLYKDGVLLEIDQKNPNGSLIGKKVPMNIFYQDSYFKVFTTSYLWTISSKDGGQTWSTPTDLNIFKRESERFMGTGPGRGLLLTQGEYKNRILIPIYDDQNGERSSVIYSDDNGKTWNRGNRVSMSSTFSPGKASESQLVQLPDGNVRVYARGKTGYIGYADSFDGGVTFEPLKEDKNLPYGHNGSGCMISVINYNGLIDGKQALIISSPEGPNRNNGIIRIGLINEYKDETGKTRYSVDWKYKTVVNKGEFQYSCLTQMPNGDISILYETAPGASRSIYKTYKIDELLNNK